MKNYLKIEEKLTFWKHVENISEEVRHWPKWMGGEGVEPLQCPTCKKPWPEEES